MKIVLVLAALVLGLNVRAETKIIKKKTVTTAQETRPATYSSSGAKLWNEMEQPDHAIIGYLGLYYVGLYPLPVTIGADYRMLINPEWALRAGFMYWSASGWATGGGTATLFDLNAGGGHVWTIKRVEIEGGGRLAFDSFHVDKEFLGWDVFGKSGNSLVIMPYAAGSFKFTPQWSVGVEVRVPIYLKSNAPFVLNEPYILSQGSYHF